MIEKTAAGRQANLPDLIEELRLALAASAREGWTGGEGGGEWLLNAGFLLGSCLNMEPEGYSMAFFNRLHRLHGELTAASATPAILERLQRIYTQALGLQIGSLKEAGEG